MNTRKASKLKVVSVFCLAISLILLLLMVPNLIRGKVQFSAQFLQTFDPNDLDTTALRKQLESSDVYEVGSVSHLDSDISYWELFVPASTQHDIQVLCYEGTQRTDAFDYDIQWTLFPGLFLHNTINTTPFYSYAKQAKVYCLVTVASSVCTIQVHTYGDTASECVIATEEIILDLFRDLSLYQ